MKIFFGNPRGQISENIDFPTDRGDLESRVLDPHLLSLGNGNDFWKSKGSDFGKYRFSNWPRRPRILNFNTPLALPWKWKYFLEIQGVGFRFRKIDFSSGGAAALLDNRNCRRFWTTLIFSLWWKKHPLGNKNIFWKSKGKIFRKYRLSTDRGDLES